MKASESLEIDVRAVCVISPAFVTGERIQALFCFTGNGFKNVPSGEASVWT